MDTAVPAPEPEDLRDDLVMRVIQLQKDLTMLGLELAYIPDFLKETRALEVGAQIPKLRKHIELMTKLKDKMPLRTQQVLWFRHWLLRQLEPRKRW